MQRRRNLYPDSPSDDLTRGDNDSDSDSSENLQFHDLSAEEQRAMANFIVEGGVRGNDEEDIDEDFEMEDAQQIMVADRASAANRSITCSIKSVRMCERDVPVKCIRNILLYLGIFPHWFTSNVRLVSRNFYNLLHLEEYLWKGGDDAIALDLVYRGKIGGESQDEDSGRRSRHSTQPLSAKPFYALGYDPNEKSTVLTPQLFRRSPYEYISTKIDFGRRVTKLSVDYLGTEDLFDTLTTLFRLDRNEPNILEELELHYPIAFHAAQPDLNSIFGMDRSDWDTLKSMAEYFPELKRITFHNFQISNDHEPEFVHRTTMRAGDHNNIIQIQVQYILNRAPIFFDTAIVRAVENHLVGGTKRCRYTYRDWVNSLRCNDVVLDSVRIKYYAGSNMASELKQASLMNRVFLFDSNEFEKEEEREDLITFLHHTCKVQVQAKNVVAALHLCTSTRIPLYLLENFSSTIDMNYVDRDHNGLLQHAIKTRRNVDFIRKLVGTYACPALLSEAYHPFESLLSRETYWDAGCDSLVGYLVDVVAAQDAAHSTITWVRGALSDSVQNVCRFVFEYDFDISNPITFTQKSANDPAAHHTHIREWIVSKLLMGSSGHQKDVDLGYTFVDGVSLADLLLRKAESYALLSSPLYWYLENKEQSVVDHAFALLAQRENSVFAMEFLTRSDLPLPPPNTIAKLLRRNPKLLRRYYSERSDRISNLFQNHLKLEHIVKSDNDDPPLLHAVCQSSSLDLLEFLVDLHGENLTSHFTDLHASTKNNVLHYVAMNDVGETEALRKDRTDTLLYLLGKLGAHARKFIEQGNLDKDTPADLTTLKRLKSEMENYDNENLPDLTDIVHRRSLSMCNTLIPTEIMHHIMEYVPAYPTLFLLRPVCHTLLHEIEDYYLPVQKTLDLVYRNEPGVKPFVESGYPDYHIGPQVFLYNPFLYMRDCFPVATHLRIDYNDDIKSQLKRIIGSHTKHAMPVQNLDIVSNVYHTSANKPKPITKKLLLDIFEILTPLKHMQQLTLINFSFDNSFSLKFTEKPAFNVELRACFNTEMDVFPAWIKIENPQASYTEKDIITWLKTLWKEERIPPNAIKDFKGSPMMLYALLHGRKRLVQFLQQRGVRVTRHEVLQCYSRHLYEAAEKIVREYKSDIQLVDEETSLFTVACQTRAPAEHLVFLLREWPQLVNDEMVTSTLQAYLSYNGHPLTLEGIFAIRNAVVAAGQNGGELGEVQLDMALPEVPVKRPEVIDLEQEIIVPEMDDNIMFVDLSDDDVNETPAKTGASSSPPAFTSEQAQHLLDLIYMLTLNPELDLTDDTFWFDTIIQTIPESMINLPVPAARSETESDVSLVHILIAANEGRLVDLLYGRKEGVVLDMQCLLLAAQNLTDGKVIEMLIGECTPTEPQLHECVSIAIEANNNAFCSQVFINFWNDMASQTKRMIVCEKTEMLRQWDMQSGGKLESFVNELSDEELFGHVAPLEDMPSVFESIVSSGYETLFKHVLRSHAEKVSEMLQRKSAFKGNNIFHFALNPSDFSSTTSCLQLVAALLKEFDHARVLEMLQEKNADGKTPVDLINLDDLRDHVEEFMETGNFQRPKRAKKRARPVEESTQDADEEDGNARKKRRISTRSRQYVVDEEKPVVEKKRAKSEEDDEPQKGDDGAFRPEMDDIDDDDELPDDLVDEAELEEEEESEAYDDEDMGDLVPEEDDDVRGELYDDEDMEDEEEVDEDWNE